MLPTLFSLMGDNSFINEMASLFSKIDFENEFLSFPKDETYENSHFNLVGGVYSMSIDIDKNVKAEDVKIDLDKKNVLTVQYSSETPMVKTWVKISENVPTDMDLDTLDANIIGSKLIITGNKLLVK